MLNVWFRAAARSTRGRTAPESPAHDAAGAGHVEAVKRAHAAVARELAEARDGLARRARLREEHTSQTTSEVSYGESAIARDVAQLRVQLADLSAQLGRRDAASVPPAARGGLDVGSMARAATVDAISRTRAARRGGVDMAPAAPARSIGSLLGTPTPTQLLPDPPQARPGDESSPASVIRNLYAALEHL